MKLERAKPTDWTKTCRCCGGKRVEIRGKYPKAPPRNICPTCTVYKLESIMLNLENETTTPSEGEGL